MAISPAELTAQRRTTEAFIRADGEVVILERSTFVSDGAGGSVRGAPAPLQPQFMRLIPLQDGSPEQMTADGEAISPSYMLLGKHDADMERWDRFTRDGERYEVVSVNSNRQYECKGLVVYHGN